MWLLEKIFISLILFYQKSISPVIGPSCRFAPSCSSYFIQAIQEHGLIKGLFMGVKRVLKCHPWGKFGLDPVPKKNERK